MAAAVSPSQRLPRTATLRRAAEFRRCYRNGRRRHGAFVTLHAMPADEGPRLGITASRKVGGAVVRNRLKRQIRERFRRHPQRAELPSADLVFHLKPTAAGAAARELAREFDRLLAELAARGAEARR